MAIVLTEFGRILVEKLNTTLAKDVNEEMKSLLNVKHDLERLKRTLERLSGYLKYAESRRYMESHAGSVVMELKDIMYDADDVIDECMVEGGVMLELHPVAVLSMIASLFPCFDCSPLLMYRHDIAAKVKALNARLEEIKSDAPLMPSLEASSTTPQTHNRNIANYSSQATSIETSNKVVGSKIEEHTEHLVSLILGNSPQDLASNINAKHECRLFGITGMGGIGKSTLARQVYNHEKIAENYAKTVWLDVSKNFSDTQLLKELIRKLGGKEKGAETKDELETKLLNCLPETIFLVLDDIWDIVVWDNLLKSPIKKTVVNCKVLFTTRDGKIARGLSRNIVHVDKMDIDSCWDLLCDMVFDDGEEEDISNLQEIGVEIVEKCDGLPLAVKAIAGILRSREKSVKEWQKVLDSGLWFISQTENAVVPNALYLSYDDLPSHLKQCFLYCILYPPHWPMFKKDLINCWVAEGFIIAQGERLLEEIAEEYYKELILRNLLQENPDVVDMSQCTMHDVYRPLAERLVKNETIFITGDQRLDLDHSTKLRHLTILNTGENSALPSKLLEHDHLRTLICMNFPKITIQDVFFERLKCLRVLVLNDTSITSLPSSIGRLLHLRNLDLDRTDIKELPESIGKLKNLLVLGLSGCVLLKELPKTLMALSNLRCLRLEESSLSYVPKGISQLTDLNRIEGFFAGHVDYNHGQDEEAGCNLEELKNLSKLRHLDLHWLKRAKGGAALALADKPFLTDLNLWWEPPQEDESMIAVSEDQSLLAEEMYGEFTPPLSLERLDIGTFPGRDLPNWLMVPWLGASFPNLAYLKLLQIPLCKQLPPQLNQLPQLKLLHIVKMEAITTIGPEFFTCSSPGATAFPKLEYLHFVELYNWEEWSSSTGVTDGRRHRLLPHIKQITVDGCYKLRALPQDLSHITSGLKYFRVKGAHELREIENVPLSDELILVENWMLEKISNSPSLKKLEISDCFRLQHVENLDALQLLELVYHAEEPDQLPPWLLRLVEHNRNLKTFLMICGSDLLMRSCVKGGAHWQTIQQIPDVLVYTVDGRLAMRYTKSPETYNTNVESKEEEEDEDEDEEEEEEDSTSYS